MSNKQKQQSIYECLLDCASSLLHPRSEESANEKKVCQFEQFRLDITPPKVSKITYRLLNMLNEPDIRTRALFLACNWKQLSLTFFRACCWFYFKHHLIVQLQKEGWRWAGGSIMRQGLSTKYAVFTYENCHGTSSPYWPDQINFI